jgi:hypothetical protein
MQETVQQRNKIYGANEDSRTYRPRRALHFDKEQKVNPHYVIIVMFFKKFITGG